MKICEQILKKYIAGRIPEGTRSTTTSKKAEAIAFCIKPLTHCLPGSDLKIGEIKTTVTKRKMQQNFERLVTL